MDNNIVDLMIRYQNMVKNVDGKKAIWKKQIYEQVFNFANKIDLEKIIETRMLHNLQYVYIRLPVNRKYWYIIDDGFWDVILSIFKNKLDNNFHVDYSHYTEKGRNQLIIMISWNQVKTSPSFTNFLKQLFE